MSVEDFLQPSAGGDRVRPQERQRYLLGLVFNGAAGLVWFVMYVVTGAWYFAVLLAVCAVIAGMAGWALLTLRRRRSG